MDYYDEFEKRFMVENYDCNICDCKTIRIDNKIANIKTIYRNLRSYLR